MSLTNGASTMEHYADHCDICEKTDGTRDHNLQRCRECAVLVHELCYGMVPTSTKDPDFVCHACKAVGKEIEVNVPSRLGGWLLRDLLATEEGVHSFREYLREEGSNGSSRDDERKMDFYVAANEFRSCEDGGASLKKRAQHIFDTYCARDAEKKVELKQDVLTEIEATIFGNEGSEISNSLFEPARKETLRVLQKTHLGEYKQSATFKTHLASQRKRVTQTNRPTECALCPVADGLHAMHPLYDFDGAEGRQLLRPASGAGIKRKEERLEWVHTLCAMFVCSAGRTRGLVYGCDENGDWEGVEDETTESKEGTAKRKVIGDDDEDEEDESLTPMEREQRDYTRCVATFEPFMDRLRAAVDSSGDAKEVLSCLDSMIDAVELVTPPFVETSNIGSLVRKAKESFQDAHPEVRARCKLFSAHMKKVYNAKKDNVPDGFEPIRSAKSHSSGENGKAVSEDSHSAQKYKIGTVIAKEFKDATGEKRSFGGKVTAYEEGVYHIKYDDGDEEDLDEAEVSKLLLTFTAWFCMAAPINGEETKETRLLKEHRDLKCSLCQMTDSGRNCHRIPVQCSAGDRYEFKDFRKYHRSLAKGPGQEQRMNCARAMHVGCARWRDKYVKVKVGTKEKKTRLCYSFSGKPPTYDGPDEYTAPVFNCFCRVHAIEIIEGMEAEKAPASRKRKKGSNMAEDSTSDHSSNDEPDDPEEKERKIKARKKRGRLKDDSDEESE